MPKERSINPAAAQRKADKQKEINKSKKNLQQQRNEKLVKRNPERVQRQIDELKNLESRGALRPKDKETLTQLERDLKGIRRARDALGDSAPKFPSHDRRDRPDVRQEQRDRRQHLGKRRRDADADADEAAAAAEEASSDTDPEVQSIPMPHDTPPPVPRNPARRGPHASPATGPNGVRLPHALPPKPPPAAPAQTTYSSAPQIRDLKKEAVKFVPAAVAQKKRQVRGDGRLLEPEEIEKLEKSGYYAAERAAEEAGKEAGFERARVGEAAKAEGRTAGDVDAEYERFEREMDGIYPREEEEGSRKVRVEEVEDEGD